MLSALAEMALAQAFTAKRLVTSDARMNRMMRLSVRIEHVLEPHPLRVEEQIDVASRTVAILPHQQLGCAFDVARRLVHVLAEQREHDVGMLLHRSERAEVVQRRSSVRPCRKLRQR